MRHLPCYGLGAEVRCDKDPENIYTLAGVDKDGKATCIITHYSENDDAEAKDVFVDFGRDGKYEVYLLERLFSFTKISAIVSLQSYTPTISTPFT